MNIAGLVKTSLIDYPDQIAAVIFTQGCNFRCGFCHNPDLIKINEKESLTSEEEVLKYLESKKMILDGVVITGGEPTVQTDLVDFIGKIKSLNLLVKLDTNGSNPKLLQELIDKKLIDYIAMDVKGPLDKYGQICSYLNKEFIQQSIKCIMESGLDYEFRTTVLPAYHCLGDFDEIGKLVKNAKRYTIQGFRSNITLSPELQGSERYLPEDLNSFADVMRKYVKNVLVHDNY